MAEDPFPIALHFVVEALSGRRAIGMGASAQVDALQALLVSPGSVQPEEPPRQDALAQSPRRSASEATVSASVQSLPPAPAKENGVVSSAMATVLPPPETVVGGTAVERMEALRAGAVVCTRCPNLAASRSQVVFGQGSPGAKLMVIGEAPGLEEDQEGRPFAGESGELLEKMLKAMGLSMGEVYATNILKCHPCVPGEAGASRPPESGELAHCLPYLAAQISIVEPSVIVALGAGVMHALFGGRTPMGSLRSRWHEVQGIPVMPTFHPRYLLRNDDVRERRKVWEDLMQVMERLGLEVTARHRSFFLKGA